MNKLFFSMLLMLGIWAGAAAQSTEDIFNASDTEIVFLGLDFTHCNFVGSETEDFTNPQDIVKRIIPNWNNLFITEKEKYDLAKTFRKQAFEYDLSYVRDRNAEIDFLKIVTENESDATHLSEEDVARIIRGYRADVPQDIALVFIVESLDKFAPQGNYWITFFNPHNNQVIFTRRMSGKPGGIGMRNYWARTYYNVLLAIQKKEFNKWRKEVSSQ
ncbi:MAG: hypothetical protein D6730_01705 [Bacteroidetes bacterium]|nr:MAG: hypothetical protein D6730_01705 [Bacteroidota bacterium]